MSTAQKISHTIYDKLFYLLIAAAAVIVILSHADYSPGWDTYVHNLLYGKSLANFYLTFGEDRSSFVATNFVCYGGLFDVPCHLLILLSPLHPLETLPLIIAFAGLAGVWGVRSLCRLVGGPAAGFWAALFLLCSAPWYGNMLINAKDVPFAAGYIWGIYFLASYLLEMPAPSLKSRIL